MRTRYWLVVAPVLLCACGVFLLRADVVSAKEKPARASSYKVVPVQSNWVTIQGTCTLEKAIEVPVMGVHDKSGAKPPKPDTTIPTERVKYDPKHLGLADCVVYLRGVKRGKDWTERDAYVLAANYRYTPHVQVVKPETQLVFVNATQMDLSSHGYRAPRMQTQWNIMIGAGRSLSEVGSGYLEEPATYLVLDDCCPWFNAFVIVAETPYYAVPTTTTGRYAITQVPPGNYEIVCWHAGMLHEAAGAPGGRVQRYKFSKDIEVVQRARVEPGKSLVIDFTVPAPR